MFDKKPFHFLQLVSLIVLMLYYDVERFMQAIFPVNETSAEKRQL